MRLRLTFPTLFSKHNSSGAEKDFEAVIDVLEGKAVYFEGYGGENMVEKSFPVRYRIQLNKVFS